MFFGDPDDCFLADLDESVAGGDDGDFNGESDIDDDVPYENPQTGARSRKRKHTPNTQDGEGTKRRRTPGGGSAKPENKANRAEVDQRIITLKKQGYSDKYIIDKLRDSGMGIYRDAKGITNRWRVLRQAEEARENRMLDEELSDWHDGEDDKLREAVTAADKKYEKELKKLQDKKWKEISTTVAVRLHKKKYTGKACRERYEALLDGTAPPPIEIDPDQEGRAILREERIAANKRRRAEEEDEKQHVIDEKERAKQEVIDREKQHGLAKVAYRESRKASEMEEKRLKLEKRIGKEQERAKKAAALKRVRDQAEQRKKTKAAEERVYHYYTGRYLIRNHGRARKGSDDYDDYDTADDTSDFDDTDEDDASTDDDAPSTKHAARVKKSAAGSKKSASTLRPAKVTKETLLNPRSIMSDAELEMLLFTRGLARRAAKETHPQVVARIAAADWNLATPELHNLLEKHFASRKGNQGVKVRRLQEKDAGASAAGGEGIKATDLEFKKGYEGYQGKYQSLIEED